MFEFAWFKKPNAEDLEDICAIQASKTMHIIGERGIAIAPEEIFDSAEFKEAQRAIRKLFPE